MYVFACANQTKRVTIWVSEIFGDADDNDEHQLTLLCDTEYRNTYR